MISALKREIETKINRDIIGRGDCEYLSRLILEESGQFLSYNTLKRLFKIDVNSKVKPRNSTLNVLSNFLGFKSYEEFKKDKTWRTEWFLLLKTSAIIDRMDYEEIISELSSPWILKKDFLISFVSLVRELFYLSKFDLIIDIFERKVINFEKLTYSEKLFLGNAIGTIFRKIDIPEVVLVRMLNNRNFIEHIFLIFVDYSSLNGYYGKVTDLCINESFNLSKDQQDFFNSLAILKDYLYTKKVKSIKYLDKDKSSFHPILVGRMASVEIIYRVQEKLGYNDLLEDISLRIKNTKKKTDYLYEITTVSLVMGDFGLMEWILKESQTINIEESYQFSHQQYQHLVSFILSIHRNRKSDIEKFKNLIDKNEISLSYFHFFEFFRLIGMYHIQQVDKPKNLNLIRRLIDQFDYPLFNDKFIFEYFSN